MSNQVTWFFSHVCFRKFSSGRAIERSDTDIEMMDYYTMLILNFSIKNTQNSLQRQYHRGQTDLSQNLGQNLGQNLLEDKN